MAKHIADYSREEILKMAEELIDGVNSKDRYNSDEPLIGKKVYLKFGLLTDTIPALVRSVHTHRSCKKYDLSLFILMGDGWHETRIYNVDSDFVDVHTATSVQSVLDMGLPRRRLK